MNFFKCSSHQKRLTGSKNGACLKKKALRAQKRNSASLQWYPMTRNGLLPLSWWQVAHVFAQVFDMGEERVSR